MILFSYKSLYRIVGRDILESSKIFSEGVSVNGIIVEGKGERAVAVTRDQVARYVQRIIQISRAFLAEGFKLGPENQPVIGF